MTLTLRIENETTLPDGGPLSIEIGSRRGVDIGRDPHLDWTLPDPTRHISGKHCEVRWHDGGYWLHDVSTNGTFLDGEDSRMAAPHRLRNGDRFVIGRYVIAADLDERDEDRQPRRAELQPAPSYAELWDSPGGAAPPINPRLLKAPRDVAPVNPDFLDWAIDAPTPQRPRAPTGGGVWDASGADSWARATPVPPPPVPEAPAVPSPRRTVWVSSEPEGPWAAPVAAERGGLWTAPVAAAAAERVAEPDAPRAAPEPAAAAAHLAGPRGSSADPGGVSAQVAEPQGLRAEPAIAPARAAGPQEVWAAPAAPVVAARAAGQQAAQQDNSVRAPSNAAPDFVAAMAQAAGLDVELLARRDPAELGAEIGSLLRLVTENMKQLLEARQHAKRLARSANQTMIQAYENNPMKFAPSTDEAMRIMFGPPTRSYLDARRAMAEAFDDVKSHQIKTYTAMQQAIKLLFASFDPAAIEARLQKDRGLMGAMGSRKARLWDAYTTEWQARVSQHEDGLLHAFMELFSQCYDREA